MSDKRDADEKVDNSVAAMHDEGVPLSVVGTVEEGYVNADGEHDRKEHGDDGLPADSVDQEVDVIKSDGFNCYNRVKYVNTKHGRVIKSVIAVEQKKADNTDVENLKMEKNDVIDGSDVGVMAISSALKKVELTVKEETTEHSLTKSVLENGEEKLDPSSIQNKTKCVDERVVLIVWTVSWIDDENNPVFNEVITQCYDNYGPDLTASIRKGLHIIFGLNLGFETTNSRSTQFVSVESLWRHVRNPTDAVRVDHALLLHRIHERIDVLTAAAFFDRNAFGVDYVRAALWLAGLMNVRCDTLHMSGQRAAPFVMFLADRVPAFEPTTSW